MNFTIEQQEDIRDLIQEAQEEEAERIADILDASIDELPAQFSFLRSILRHASKSIRLGRHVGDFPDSRDP
jgi:hypothetical protein